MLPLSPSSEDSGLSTSAELLRLAQWIRNASRLLIVTGAGISADSGLPTYRGVGGLYDDASTEDGFEIEDALSGRMMQLRPEVCWKYIGQVEHACREAEPNRAHRVITELQRHLDVVVLTQNVDGLHRSAGTRELIEMHGNVHELHCTRCEWERWVPDYADLELPPRCPRCGAGVRPRVVLFGEALPELAVTRLEREIERGFCVVLVVGTTAVFPYIAAPVLLAPRWGARTAEINPGRSMISDKVDLRIEARAAPTFDALASCLGYG